MALSASEAWKGGFVVDTSKGNVLSMTTSTVNSRWSMGFLRDPDGRLVVVII